MVRTLGVEEELLLVDPATRELGSRSAQVLKEFREHGPGREPAVADDELDSELFRHQLEIRTEPETDLAEIRRAGAWPRRARGRGRRGRRAGDRGERHVPRGGGRRRSPTTSATATWWRPSAGWRPHGGTCGMHVHVAIDSDEEGVAVHRPDRAVAAGAAGDRRQLAVPRGRATPAMPRGAPQLWARWPSAGRHRAVRLARGLPRRLPVPDGVRRGARRGDALLRRAALARHNPTVEVRVPDVCTDPEDALLVAALVRGPGGDGRQRRPTPAGARALARRGAARLPVAGGAVRRVRHAACDPVAPRAAAGPRGARRAWSSWSRTALARRATPTGWPRGSSGCCARTARRRQRAAYERTGDVEGVVDDLIAAHPCVLGLLRRGPFGP